MKKIIEVVPYNYRWPHIFEVEATRIKEILGDTCIQMYHT